ncbi:hypothetical protein ACIQWV_15830 [Streptomyces sp. NPDC098085]|uniref:hypothetical protein n=1 Tax=Streptomyces sp. NPDC098085 TaxID=3366094 RepID=UPI003813B133
MSFLVSAVGAIHRYWPELSALLDPPAREELMEILADAEADPTAAARDIRELVKPFTPPGHPAREALTPSGVRFQPSAVAPSDSAQLLALLRTLRTESQSLGLGTEAAPDTDPGEAPADAGPGETAPDAEEDAAPYRPDADPGTTGPDASPRPAAPDAEEDAAPYRPDADDAWLLAEPAVPAVSVDLAADRARDLILLTDEHEVEWIPAFQIDLDSGVPYPVVVEINRLLSADADPWGAADWWLGSNVWLDAAPARLLGTGADGALLSAARAEIPDW